MLCGFCVDRRVLGLAVARRVDGRDRRAGRAHHPPDRSHAHRRHVDGGGGRRPIGDRSRSICSAALWMLPIRGGEAEAHHARAARSAPADLVARQPVDRVPGLRRRHLAHLRDHRATAATPKAVTQRRVRRPRAGVVARRIAHRVLVGSLRRHHDDLGGRCRAAASCGASARATAAMPTWSPNDRRDHVRRRDDRERSGPADVRERARPLGGEHATAASGLVADATRERHAGRRGVEPDGTDLAHTLAGGTLSVVNGQRRAAADEDVLPVPPAVDLAHRVHLHRRRPHQAAIARPALTPRSSRSPPRSRCSAARSRSRTARSSLPGRSGWPASSSPVVSPDGRAIAFTAMGDLWMLPVGGTPVQITERCGVRARSGVVARQHAARLRERSRRTHGSLGPRSARRADDAADARARARVSGPAWSRDGIADRLPRRSPRDRGPCASARRLPRRRDDAGVSAESSGGRRGRPAAGRSRWARCFPYSDRYREGLNQLLLVSRSTPARRSESVLVSAALRRQPSRTAGRCGRRTVRTWRSSPKAGCGRSPVDGDGGAIGPPHVDRRRSAGVAELGRRLAPHRLPDAERSAPRPRRRQPARPDRARPDLARRRRRPERVVVHAGHVVDGVARGAARRVGHRRSSAASSAASRRTATNCTPARSSTPRPRP